MIELPKLEGVAFIGVDPGKQGAIQIVYLETCKLLTKNISDFMVGRKFDEYLYAEWLSENIRTSNFVDYWMNYIVTCELVKGWGDISSNAAFNWGEATGAIKQGLVCHGLRVGLRDPNNWKSWYKKQYQGLKVKSDYLTLAKELFPYFEINTTDQADALLIGYCGFYQTMELRSKK